MSGGSSATVNGESARKAGTKSVAGSMTITVGAGATRLEFYAAGWSGETVELGITGATATPSSGISITSNSAISGSGTSYSLTNIETYKVVVQLANITANTTLTISATSGNRFVVWGAVYYK